jgi:hypothetical protein
MGAGTLAGPSSVVGSAQWMSSSASTIDCARAPAITDPSKEEPKRMERLCFRAFAEGIVSESKAAEILGIPVRELTRRMDQPSVS